MLQKVYIETSVIGAYFDQRSDIVSASQRYWSQLWWNQVRFDYEVVVSEGVINE